MVPQGSVSSVHIISWTQRSELLRGSSQKKCTEFFETYRACVPTLSNAKEWQTPLLELLDLSLN